MKKSIMYGIIYKATNLINGKVYIGQTVKSLDQRKLEHARASNGVLPKLYFHKAIRKYGADNFTWEIIDEASTKEELDEKEISYILSNQSLANLGKGYNLSSGGHYGNVFTGKTEEEKLEIRKKLSDSHKGEKNHNFGKPRLEETKERIGKSNTGKVKSDKWRAEQSARIKGTKLSEETRRNISNAGKGRRHTEETRKKMSNSQKGRVVTEECKEKISNALKGRRLSDETKNKISDASRGKIVSELTKSKLSANNGKCKKVMCLETGQIFYGIKYAALVVYGDKKFQLRISKSIKDGKPRNGYSWIYYKETTDGK